MTEYTKEFEEEMKVLGYCNPLGNCDCFHNSPEHIANKKCEQDHAVDHPKHYNEHPSGIECIQVVRHFNFCIGNAIKYLWRAGLKNDDIEDLKKARWYIDDEIKSRQEKSAGTDNA